MISASTAARMRGFNEAAACSQRKGHVNGTNGAARWLQRSRCVFAAEGSTTTRYRRRQRRCFNEAAACSQRKAAGPLTCWPAHLEASTTPLRVRSGRATSRYACDTLYSLQRSRCVFAAEGSSWPLVTAAVDKLQRSRCVFAAEGTTSRRFTGVPRPLQRSRCVFAAEGCTSAPPFLPLRRLQRSRCVFAAEGPTWRRC